jgi:hypothetical protein
MLLPIFRWTMFVWGCAAFFGMAYYAVQWLPRIDDAMANELGIGFMLCAFYGWPTWLSLPVLAFASRKSMPAGTTALLLMPVVAATLLFGVSRLLAGTAA